MNRSVCGRVASFLFIDYLSPLFSPEWYQLLESTRIGLLLFCGCNDDLTSAENMGGYLTWHNGNLLHFFLLHKPRPIIYGTICDGPFPSALCSLVGLKDNLEVLKGLGIGIWVHHM